MASRPMGSWRDFESSFDFGISIGSAMFRIKYTLTNAVEGLRRKAVRSRALLSSASRADSEVAEQVERSQADVLEERLRMDG